MSKAALLIGGFVAVAGVIGLVTGAGAALKKPNFCLVTTGLVTKCVVVSYTCPAYKRCGAFTE